MLTILRGQRSLILLGLLAFCGGCGMPKYVPPPLTGPLTDVEANKIFTKMLMKHGARYKRELEWNGKPFVANWELGTKLQRTQLLQLKPKTADFTVTELCMALEVAVNDYEYCPWHPVMSGPILSGYRRSLRGQGSSGVSSRDAPPYAMSVLVKKHSVEWFCQVKGYNDFDFSKVGT